LAALHFLEKSAQKGSGLLEICAKIDFLEKSLQKAAHKKSII
jgi:hypothetical protein